MQRNSPKGFEKPRGLSPWFWPFKRICPCSKDLCYLIGTLPAFLSRAGLSETAKQPYARSAPHPPRPFSPSQSPGGEGGPSGFGCSFLANISVHQRSCLHARRPYKRSPPAPSPPAKARRRRGAKRLGGGLFKRILKSVSGWGVGRDGF